MRKFIAVSVLGIVAGLALMQAAESNWRGEAVTSLNAVGIETAFPDGSFLGEEPLTGYQAAVLADQLLRVVDVRGGCATELPPEPEGVFAGAPEGHWATDALRRLSTLDVAEAFPEGFSGDELLSGFQTAALMSEVLSTLNTKLDCGGLAYENRVIDLESQLADLNSAFASGVLTGPAGPQGEPGEPGPRGETGPAGPAGPRGEVGPAGETGLAGPRGEPGPQGEVGPPGEAGLACWDRNGNGRPDPSEDSNDDGAFTAQDCVGLQGEAGPPGPRGEPGPEGDRGPEGSTGPRGPEGSQGDEGPRGPEGPEGDDGPQGPQGPRGPQGPQGPPG